MEKRTRRASVRGRLLAALALAVLAALAAPARARASAAVADPRVVADDSMKAGQVATWDCVWLGSYPQSYVGDAASVAALDAAAGWDEDGDLEYGGATYRRLRESDATYSDQDGDTGYWDWGSKASPAGWCYFLWEPVKWRVLEADGDEALVVSDVALDDRRYDETYTGVTWEACTLRSWLNGAFLADCLGGAQQGAVVGRTLANADNVTYGTDGGAETTDRAFLLAESDVWGGADAARHGFATDCDTYDEARRCRTSDYAHAMGVWNSTSSYYEGNCYWWLRSPGHDADRATYVFYDGYVDRYGYDVNYYDIAVRPALSISLSSNQVSYAGTATATFEIRKAPSTISLAAQTKTYTGRAIAYSGKVTRSGSGGAVSYEYFADAKCTKAVKATNVKAAGTYYVRATLAADEGHEAATSEAVRLTVNKAANPLAAKGKSTTVKLASVKKKAQVLAASKVVAISKAQGKRSYKVAKWTSKNAKKYLKIDAKTGRLTVKKGTPKGTYKFQVKVTATGNANYKAGTKAVSVKVVVR